MKATHKTYDASVQTGKGYTTVTLKPGQLIFGRNKAAEELKCSPSTIRNRLMTIGQAKNEMLDIKPDTHYSIVTIRNWGLYQTDAEELGQAKGQAITRKEDTYKNKDLQEQRQTPEGRRASSIEKRKGKAKSVTTINHRAVRMYEWYAENIVNEATERMEAIGNIIALLDEGHQIQHLGEAMSAYANDERTLQTEERYRIRARTFFGKKKGYAGFPPYLGGKGEPIRETKEPYDYSDEPFQLEVEALVRSLGGEVVH